MYHSSLLPFILPLAHAATNAINVRDAPASLPYVTSIQYSGSGCPSSAPGVDKLGAWNDLAFRLNNFEVALPNAAASTENCEVHLQVSGCSAGWQLGIKDVYVRGHLVLDPGAELDFYVTNFWSQDAGATSTVRGVIENTGSTRIDDIATAHATIPNSRVVWSPCSSSSGDIGILNVNFRAALQADGTQYGYFGKGGDTTLTESYGYVWRRC
ncbi:hypothetical protein G7054_g11612 [Neopestalotiopsis clavispora]|nr:hypothetical protein G7054_g11612 [Neopestalotiopsis clavispora]